ncbi:MAG: hypothetical protein M4D80_07230 [Myxococcota bacterium]|nr:hypothetical protein [Deltaproteobacteria bacterium]MDQ3334935.1 hypothetical protein [Myxococcota bacterium]
MTAKKFQLVVQVPRDLCPTTKDVVAFEERLAGCLPRTCDVDGFDVGAGTVNFFVYTDAPEAAHRTFRKYLGTRKVEQRLRIAYRPTKGETFTNLWPRRDPRVFDYSYDPANDPFARGAKRAIPKRSKPKR